MKIYQIQDGSSRTEYSFPLTTGAYGDIDSAVGSSHAKLTDPDINAMAAALDGYSHIYRIKSSDCPEYLYVKTNDAYVDTSASFGLTSENALVGLGSSYGSVPTWATLPGHGIDLRWTSPILTPTDTCCRYLFGHGATDCYSGPSGYRCVNGGSGCGPYKKLDDVVFYIYAKPRRRVRSKFRFASAGTAEQVTSVVTSYLVAKCNVTEDQLTVTVSRSSDLSVRRLSASSVWDVDFAIVAPTQAAEEVFQITQDMSQDGTGTALALQSAFVSSGLEMDDGSLSVTAPQMETILDPTPSPTPSPTPDAGTATATGDPHLRNVHGQRFDLMKPGRHILINIPRGERTAPFLRVRADARRLGGCTDMYFRQLNITGSWAEARQHGGYHYSASDRAATKPQWVGFGKVETKVVHGRTERGLEYLNFYVKHLGRSGYVVGGLLGEDDHTDVSIPPDECRRKMSLWAPVQSAGSQDPAEASVAVANSDE